MGKAAPDPFFASPDLRRKGSIPNAPTEPFARQRESKNLYRSSKAALNRFAKSIQASRHAPSLTVLLVHLGWVRTEMGTLGGTVEAEIDPDGSIRDFTDVVERHLGSGEILYRDHQDQAWPW